MKRFIFLIFAFATLLFVAASPPATVADNPPGICSEHVLLAPAHANNDVFVFTNINDVGLWPPDINQAYSQSFKNIEWPSEDNSQLIYYSDYLCPATSTFLDIFTYNYFASTSAFYQDQKCLLDKLTGKIQIGTHAPFILHDFG